jgi:thiosulfate reductase/polysulfide reductase chain A
MEISRRGFLKGAAIGVAASYPLFFKQKAHAGILSSFGVPEPGKYPEIKPFKPKVTRNWCEMCFWGCGIDVFTENGRVRKIEGNPYHPYNYGKVCARGNAGVMLLYDPDRLKTPLKRVGERGEGKWEKISWDEAINTVAKEMTAIKGKYGAKALAIVPHGTAGHAAKRLFDAMGAKNSAEPSYSSCRASRLLGWFGTYGKDLSSHEYYDIANSKYILLVGRNIAESVMMGDAKNLGIALSKHAKIIYVDPRFTKTAAKADEWLPIKPGTDMAFVLALINVIIKDALYNADFIENYCYGFYELREHIEKYTPEWAEKETDIPATTIKKIAWELARYAPSSVVIPARRTSRYGDDTQNARAIAILNALLGNWEMPGGYYHTTKIKAPKAPLPKPPKIRNFQRADNCGKGSDFPLAPASFGRTNGLVKAIAEQKPYPIKSLFVCGANPVMNVAKPGETLKKAIENLDFIVTVDVYPTEMCLYSDIILPASTYLEKYGDLKAGGAIQPFIAYREPAVKPLYDTKGEWEICRMIAKKMGLEEYFPMSMKEIVEYKISKLSLEEQKELKKNGVIVKEGDPYRRAQGKKIRFSTPTGKVELYSTLFKKHGYDPLPVYSRPASPPEGSYRFLFGRVSVHTHARTENNSWLHETYPVNKLWINKDEAGMLGIKNGDKVVLVQGNKKSPSIETYVTSRIRKNCVFIAHGFGGFSPFLTLCYEKGVLDGEFASEAVDPISGAYAYHKDSFVKIKKA